MATIGQQVTSSDFNNLRTTIIGVMGIGAGQSGYGQDTSTLTAVAPGAIISSTDMGNLRTQLAKAWSHQTNTSVLNTAPSGGTLNPPNMVLVVPETVIASGIFTQYENFAAAVLAQQDTHAAAQLTPVALESPNRTTAWGASPDVISATVTFTFPGYTTGGTVVSAENHARAFFNAGGTLELNSTLAGGTVTAKYNSWLDIFTIGTLSFGKTGSTLTTPANLNPGNIFSSLTGFYDLTVGAAATTLLSQPGTAGVYAENDYVVTVARPTTNTITFVISYRDDDQGDDQGGIGSTGPVDETINGTLTANLVARRPFGANVDVPPPTKSGATTIV